MDHPWLIALTDSGGNWHFGIGDPTPMGWFICFTYFVATVLAAMTWAAEHQRRLEGRGGSPTFWLVLTILLLFLGVNKQLDLQTLLQDTVRWMAKANNWYKTRRLYQGIFIALVVMAGLGMLGTFSWLARRQWKRNIVALLGTVVLYVFIFIRASSLHHVDIALQWRLAGMKWNWILELGGILVTMAGTLVVLRDIQGANRQPSRGDGADDSMGVKRYSFDRGSIVSGPDKRPPAST